MPSFRTAREQAYHAVRRRVALGKARHDAKDDGKIHSVRTAQAYTQALHGFARFIQENRLGDLKTATVHDATAYLQEPQESGLSQKSLDLDRQALQCHFQQPLERLRAVSETVLSTRSYTPAQIREIAAHQNERNALATCIAFAAGLRAHELQTLRLVVERPPSTHRIWRTDRFSARNGHRYTVEGKGGLVREILIPHDLAVRLESYRIAEGPVAITDRGINYLKYYNIGSGKNWSTSFSRVSRTRLGWSNGAHGVRHTYAQQRMSELQMSGYPYQDALGVVAQELGHFAPSTTEAYLR